MSDPILLEIDDGIALVTLNRPDKLNALNYALIDRLMATLDAIETDDGVRAVILTGEAIKRHNARAIAELFSEVSGKFVCASAGHHMECQMAAHGSGAVAM